MGLGVAFTPFETRTDVIVRVAIKADEAGLDRVGVAEGWTHDSTILLRSSPRGRRGSASARHSLRWGRTPATSRGRDGAAAMSGGRFTLGVGAAARR